jgi:hypothetical protein
MKSKRFPKSIVAAIRDNKILGLRAGKDPHSFIGIWAVVVVSGGELWLHQIYRATCPVAFASRRTLHVHAIASNG